MSRVGLVIFLMLVTLAGPAWCCCSLSRLATVCLPSQSSVKKGPGCGCRCQTTSPSEHTTPSEVPSENKPSPPRKSPCPCHDLYAERIAALALEERTEKFPGEWNLYALSFTEAVPCFQPNCLVIGTRCPLSPRSFIDSHGPALLSLLQTFRC